MDWILGNIGRPPPPPPHPFSLDPPVCLGVTEGDAARSRRERDAAFRRVRRLEESWRLTMELQEIEHRGEQASG